MHRLRRLLPITCQIEPLFQYDSRRRICSLVVNRYFNLSIEKDNNTTNEYIYVNLLSNTFRQRPSCSPNIVVRHVQDKSHRPSDTCWNCQSVLKVRPNLNKLFCDSCKSLQPFDQTANLFDILGIKESYKLNESELKKKFRNLQSLLHPDKFSAKPKKEQELSEEFSSVVNKAYSTLLDPLERGLYMLNLNNMSIEEGTTDVDNLFLMEIMERNEEIENECDPVKLHEYYKSNREQLDILISKVAKAFDNNDIELAKKLLTEMKYYNTIENKIKGIKQKLNIPD